MVAGKDRGDGSRALPSEAFTIAAAVALFAAITAVRLLVDDPGEGIGALYVLPVAMIAARFSRRASLIAAAGAFALFAIVTLALDQGVHSLGFVNRAVLFAGVALIVHQYASRAQRAEQFNWALIESLGEGIGACDAEGRLTVFNRENRRIIGLDADASIAPEDWAGHYRINDPESGEQMEPGELPLVRALRGERVRDAELVIAPEGREPRYVSVNAEPLVDASGNSLGAVATLRDETERLRNEQERRRLAAIVESSADAISTAELDGTITSWNAGARRLFGYAAREVLGRNMDILLPPEVQGAGREILERISGAERIDDLEFDVVRKDGTRVPVSMTAAPIFDRESRIVGAASILRDVSERKAAEAEAERLKSEFFALVSHELRTPLTSILGYADVLAEAEAEQLSDQGRRFLEIIGRNTRRLDRLVQDLLLIAQVEAGSFGVEIGSVDLAAVARDGIEELRPTAEEAGVELALEAGEIAPFPGDATRLAQVLDNLVSNAIKFTPKGGRVDVRTYARDGDAVIEVADTGVGIAADEKEHLFDRFYRAGAASRDHIKGVGLGLAITKAIVEGHRGRIEIESEPGRGTTFRVLLPLDAPGTDDRSEPDRVRSVS